MMQPVLVKLLLSLLILTGSSAIWQATVAQSSITTIFSHPQNATTATSYTGNGANGLASSGLASNTYNYRFGTNVAATNNTSILDSFITLGLNYYYLDAPLVVKFRRVDNATATGLRKSFWIESLPGSVSPGGTVSILPDYDDSLERVFSQRLLNVGIDNIFHNSSSTNNINIERMDVIFPGGVSATDATRAGFAVFDRGNSGGHDPLYIAAIRTLDINDDPSDYFDAVPIVAGNYGGNVVGSFTYMLFRKNDTDARLLLDRTTTTQNRDGTFLRFFDLGVPANTMIYGYSIFSPDTDVTPAINMVDYTNATNFPTNTDLGGGGLDPLAITGLWVTDASYVILEEQSLHFQAVMSNDKTKLSWQYQQPDNLQKIIIERSANAVSYEPILSFTISTGYQTAFDIQPLAGKNYYRMKLLHTDGAVSYSKVCVVERKSKTFNDLVIYPNPVTNKQFSLHVSGLKNQSYQFRLINISGHLVWDQAFYGAPVVNRVFNLPGHISPGIYVAQLTDTKGNKVFEQNITVQ